MNNSSQRGFTLIELLVVIAIIGVLSSVVLLSLNTARNKGNDAGVKANLSTVVTQANLFYDENSQSYGTFDDGLGGVATCPLPATAGTSVLHDATIENAIASANLDSTFSSTYCIATPLTFAVATKRPAGGTSTFWCVDSAGAKCGNDGNAGDGATPIIAGACVACTTTQ